jgi:hypothetical protein
VREEREHWEGEIAKERKSEKRESIVSREEEESIGAARLLTLLPLRAGLVLAPSCVATLVPVVAWPRCGGLMPVPDHERAGVELHLRQSPPDHAGP